MQSQPPVNVAEFTQSVPLCFRGRSVTRTNHPSLHRLTQRLKTNLSYLAAMAEQFEHRDNVSALSRLDVTSGFLLFVGSQLRPPPHPPILDAPTTPVLGPRLTNAYTKLKGYFVASERFEHQSQPGAILTPIQPTVSLPPVPEPRPNESPVPTSSTAVLAQASEGSGAPSKAPESAVETDEGAKPESDEAEVVEALTSAAVVGPSTVTSPMATRNSPKRAREEVIVETEMQLKLPEKRARRSAARPTPPPAPAPPPPVKRTRNEAAEEEAELSNEAKKTRVEDVPVMSGLATRASRQFNTAPPPEPTPAPPAALSYPTPSSSTQNAPSPFNGQPKPVGPPSRTSTPTNSNPQQPPQQHSSQTYPTSSASSPFPPSSLSYPSSSNSYPPNPAASFPPGSNPFASGSQHPMAAIPPHLQSHSSPAHQYTQLSAQQQAYMRQQQQAGMAAQQQQTLLAQQHFQRQQLERQQQELEANGARRTPSVGRIDGSPRVSNVPTPPPRPMSSMSQQGASHGSPAYSQDGSAQHQPQFPQQPQGPPLAQLEQAARAATDQFVSVQNIVNAPTYRQLPPPVQNQMQAQMHGLYQAMQAAQSRFQQATAAAAQQGALARSMSPGPRPQMGPGPQTRTPSFGQSPQLQQAQVRVPSAGFGGSHAGSVAGSHAGSPPSTHQQLPASAVESSASYFREQ